MKLYTEEQVRMAIMVLCELNSLKENVIMNSLTPIELPSDEEMEDKGKWIFNNAGHTIYSHYNTVPSWVEGAKWMKEQILNQNK